MINRIIACVKLSVDPLSNMQIIDNQLIIDGSNIRSKNIISRIDRCVIEETVRLGKKFNAETIAISVGEHDSNDMLRRCIAYGLDRAVRIAIDASAQSALSVAHLLSKQINTIQPDLIICGQRSVDYCGGVVGPYISEILGLPQLTNVSKIEFDLNRNALLAYRQLEHGDRNIVESSIPAIICVTENINIPQYLSIKKYLNVSKHLIDEVIIQEDAKLMSKTRIVQQDWPKPRAKKIDTPDSTMSAAERMKFMMSGGLQKQQGSIYTGNVNGAVDRMIQSLRDQDIL